MLLCGVLSSRASADESRSVNERSISNGTPIAATGTTLNLERPVLPGTRNPRTTKILGWSLGAVTVGLGVGLGLAFGLSTEASPASSRFALRQAR